MAVVRFELAMIRRRRAGMTAVLVLVPTLAEARTPLPTIEVVQPKRRVRLLDLRWNVQVGGAIALGDRVPLLALGQGVQISFVELSKTWQLHAALTETGLADLSRGWRARRGLLGADLGLGVSRHRVGGPALVATVTAGPRWASRPASEPRTTSWRIDGWGVMGQLEAYPFYLSMPELIASDAGGFRRFVLSGLGLWATVRYDAVKHAAGTPALAAGGSIDVGRTVLAPIVMALKRR